MRNLVGLGLVAGVVYYHNTSLPVCTVYIARRHLPGFLTDIKPAFAKTGRYTAVSLLVKSEGDSLPSTSDSDTTGNKTELSGRSALDLEGQAKEGGALTLGLSLLGRNGTWTLWRGV